MQNKKGAMEMSVGTIVTIVLLMAVLVLGVVLIKNIFGGAKNVVDMTNDQLESEISKLFGEDKKMVIYPSSREITIKQGDANGFAIGIKNLLQGTTGEKDFFYEINVADVGNCGVEESEIEEWIIVGKSESGISIPSNGFYSPQVHLLVPEGSPLCTFKLRVSVNVEENSYATDSIIITVK